MHNDVLTTPNKKSSATKRKLKTLRENNPQKRSKIVSLKVAARKPPSLHPKPIAPIPKRTSPRAKKTVQRPDYSDMLDLDQAIASHTEPTLYRDNDAGAAYQTSTREHSEHVEEVLHYIRTNQPSTVSDSVSSMHESTIDPYLERLPSPAFSMNAPKHQASPQRSHQSRSISFDTSPTHVAPSSNFELETVKVLPSARTMFTRDPTYATNQTTASPASSLFPGDSEVPIFQDNSLSPATNSGSIVASSTDSKAGISFNYIVILSRAPIYQYKSWKPRGHFLEKSLSELINELPFENNGGITGLTIRLTSHGVDVKETLERDQDANYNSTKRRFMQTVKSCLKNHNKTKSSGVLVVDFEIEAVREEIVEEDDEDDDDIVF